jgi:eukaryotic-like serine/threonine-protein kinase
MSDPHTLKVPPSPPGSVVLGERVHNYEIVSKIGEGGMGAVYLASHQFFERKAALKVLHPQLSNDDSSVRRFMNEARAANAIRHPNIIEVVDTGFLPRSGAPYLLTEYLEGESLGARLRRLGRLPFDSALQIAGQTTSALAAAHEKGIIHRDLKPENLFLLSRPGSADLVKVLDFGIAKLRTEVTGQPGDTQPGTFLGTPKYMSPEQCRGGSWPIDHRADIYSLGIILYEMLCGVHPFDGMGVVELLAVHLMAEPARPRSHVPDLPAYIEEAVLRAVRKQPSERFASMREFRSALGSAAIPRVPAPSLQMQSDPLAPLTGGEPRSRRRWIALALGLLLVGGGAAAAGAWRAKQKRLAGFPPPPPAASLPRPSLPPPQPTPPRPSESPRPPPSEPAARSLPPPTSPAAARAVAPPARRRQRGKRALPPPPAAPAPAPPKKFVPPMW